MVGPVDPRLTTRVSRTQEEQTMSATTQYQVTGMTCGHCETSVREEVSEVAGVQDVQVSHETGTLAVTGDVDEAAVLAAVTEAGYSATRA